MGRTPCTSVLKSVHCQDNDTHSFMQKCTLHAMHIFYACSSCVENVHGISVILQFFYTFDTVAHERWEVWNSLCVVHTSSCFHVLPWIWQVTCNAQLARKRVRVPLCDKNGIGRIGNWKWIGIKIHGPKSPSWGILLDCKPTLRTSIMNQSSSKGN